MTHQGRAVLYARFSSKASSPLSNEDQLSLAREYATEQGYTVTGEFWDDEKHGEAIENRPYFLKMCELIERGDFDAVIVEELDRLARSTSKGTGFFDMCTFHNCKVVTLSDGVETAGSAAQKFAHAQQSNRTLAQKVRRGQQLAVTDRSRYIGGIAYGYETDWIGRPPKPIRKVNDAEAEIIRRIFEEYDAGAGSTAICKRLNEEGVPAPGRNRKDARNVWDPGVLTGGPKLNTGILRNPIYVGKIRYGNKINKKHHISGKRVTAKFANPKPVMGYNPDLGIVAQELFDRVQERLAANHTASGPKSRQPKFLLSGKLFCDECGSSYVMIERRYMACSGHARIGICSNKRRISYLDVEAGFITNLERLLNKPSAGEAFVDLYATALQDRVKGAPDEKARLEKQLSEKRSKIRGTKESLSLEGLPIQVRSGLAQSCAEMMDEEATLEARLRDLSAVPRVVKSRDEIACRMRDQLLALTGEMRREGPSSLRAIEAVRALVDRITVTATRAPSGKEYGYRGASLFVEGQIASLLRLGEGLEEIVITLTPTMQSFHYHDLGNFSFEYEIGSAVPLRAPSQAYEIVRDFLASTQRPVSTREVIGAVLEAEPITMAAAASRVRSSTKRLVAEKLVVVDDTKVTNGHPQARTYEWIRNCELRSGTELGRP